ncbi:MAG: hypothetical protein A2431_03245 [Candidatus Zambryskibacteria bacterium RIFOXYC1_FULL_39_10]|uniref:Prepilin-type N-terminal cleavage/methylation domain-containing protein n=1 Tax=Candidatus Zambryskibacteria bacterium RIFOXYC1_FULL_39_10 TaxID=1802779 RepID=A0A1G2V0P9_9BACT|nr:MAG: hypothetical protein A2431_03245 [Candidatus Zambryskibacteria bacterium RIFOXYC1_FULL_39_10]OHB16249.1 MAG: hypothetical protein A2605_01395 [Candidatus Zambryskibacteria bacterium RIFOXYD1_FULL_39_35]
MKKGFTLIELLVVIAIISVLSSIVVTSLNNSRYKAKLTKALVTMKQINNSAFMCLDGGGTLVIPASSGAGGTAICSNNATILLPNISDTTFTYCGTGCGGWTSNSSGYAFSIYTDSIPGGRKIVVCGTKLNVNGWYGLNIWDFTNDIGCRKSGF